MRRARFTKSIRRRRAHSSCAICRAVGWGRTRESCGRACLRSRTGRRTKNSVGSCIGGKFPLAHGRSDASELVRELERRHPEGWAMNLAESFFAIVQRRGRDVFPYVMRHLNRVWRGWFARGSYGKMADYAREQGWWDMWSALIRVCSAPREFNKEVLRLLDDRTSPESGVVGSLLALRGASRGWKWP